MAKKANAVAKSLVKELGEVTNHDQLKEFGAKLVNTELSAEDRTEVVQEYRKRRNELDRKMVKFSRNSAFKKMLYSINTMTAENFAKVGQTIYDLADVQGVLSRHETDLCFRSYWHQKNKLGIGEAA